MRVSRFQILMCELVQHLMQASWTELALICCKIVFLKYISANAEFAEEGTFFANRFPSLRTFVNKKSWNLKKIRPPSIQLLKLI